ncbi:LysR family transcriptional regulator [Neobacillus cucumis]|uniref:LysR family transcriptional regulator n=1 Tax=Neobacillus cucumis TaxID=1740721 RepID=UPI00203AF7B3|nr:LysR family transcriptional regulator [Neobacillus cucumis]MCM3726501.1 LysR family transcriptional regulator [Neobacillus cucumis]
MDIRRMKYFVSIVEEGQISLAAKRLNIAQPPLSQQLKLFEEELNTKLFERHTRKLILTDEGKFLYERSLEILEMIEKTKQELNEISSGISGTLSIGMIPSLGAELIPEKVKDFHKKYPNVRFKVWEGDSNRIMELTEKRIIELGIVRLPVDKDVFDSINLSSEPIVAAMSENMGFENDSASINLAELKDKPLMFLRSYKKTSDYRTSVDAVDMVKSACTELGFEPTILCESSNLVPLLNWANCNIGIGIVPKSAEKIMPNSKLIFKKIINPEVMARPSALIWLKKRHLTSAAIKFMEYFG